MKYERTFRARMTQGDYDWIRETATEMRMSQQDIVRWGLALLREELDTVQGQGGIASRVVQASVEVSKVKAAPKQTPKRGNSGSRPLKTKPEKDPAKRDKRSPEDRALGKLAALTREIEAARDEHEEHLTQM